MKRILMLGVLGMAVTMFSFAQDLQRGDATWYETPGSISLRASHATLPFGTRIRVTNLNNNNQTIVTISGRIPNEPDRILDISQEAAKNLGMANPSGSAKTPITIEVLGGARTAEAPPPPPPEPEPEPAPEPEPEPAPPPPPPPEPVPAPAPEPAPPVVVQAPAPAAEPKNLTINIYINGQEKAAPKVEEPAPEPPPPPAPQFPPATVLPRMPDPSSSGVYRVQVGSYLSPLNAQNTFERLKAMGFNPAYEKYEDYYRVVLSGVWASDMRMVAQQLGNAGVKEVWIRQEY